MDTENTKPVFEWGKSSIGGGFAHIIPLKFPYQDDDGSIKQGYDTFFVTKNEDGYRGGSHNMGTFDEPCETLEELQESVEESLSYA